MRFLSFLIALGLLAFCVSSTRSSEPLGLKVESKEGAVNCGNILYQDVELREEALKACKRLMPGVCVGHSMTKFISKVSKWVCMKPPRYTGDNFPAMGFTPLYRWPLPKRKFLQKVESSVVFSLENNFCRVVGAIVEQRHVPEQNCEWIDRPFYMDLKATEQII
ncbi:hypothetical protein GcM3_065026 [Golovinomyces cichoracearum]|uniref:Secreted effector protein n=1 Tax=Golovinomyces cichoracearum TaxID=62708 RepID=A0A420IUY7_9PEZI|nr:hypothetical protein GcM3_065026 [Golovinomyces cichoracearum]